MLKAGAKPVAVRVDPAGRILIPASIRRRHGLHPGSVVIVQEAGPDKLSLSSQASAVRAAQAYFGKLRHGPELWSEELIQERRAAARREYGR
ncbi:MAG: AbrB/MazE/SpoVT family DNA-binding domain-containing protein [Terriglobales bacterium]